MRRETKYINRPIVLRFVHFFWIAYLSFLLAACGGSDSSSGAGSESSAGQAEDMLIASAVYFDQRTPEGFYQDPYTENENFQITSHVKNIDLLPFESRAGQAVYELTSDDFSEAMDWSEQAAVLQISYKPLVDNTETAIYHQFTRADPNSPEFIYLQRVLKASVIDRNGVNDDYKGRITLSNMTAADVKLIVEYLWTFTLDNNFGNAVLSSVTTEKNDEYIHVMQQAKLNMSFTDSCDSIEVYEVTYTIPKASGFINREVSLKRVILTKRTGNVLKICET